MNITERESYTVIAFPLVESFTCNYETGMLTTSHIQGVIALLDIQHKKLIVDHIFVKCRL